MQRAALLSGKCYDPARECSVRSPHVCAAAECEQKLELLLNLMAAFAARYLDAAHAPAGLLGEVLNEADAEERVRAAVQTLAAR